MANYITAVGVQQVTITIAASATSGTATISAVGSGAFLMYGFANTTAPNEAQSNPRITLTNSTTITATRDTSSGQSVIVKCSVIDATPSLIQSIQFGTVTITTGNASATASISSVNANNTVIQYLGHTTGDTVDSMSTSYPVLSISGTTITSTVQVITTSNNVVSFCAIEFASGAMNQNVQSYSKTWTSGTSATQTVTSVNVNNALIFLAGRGTTATTNFGMGNSYADLTNATTVTVHNTTALTATTNTYNFFLVEFISGVLNSNIQRGALIITGTASNTATITSVSTTASGCHSTGTATSSTTPNKMFTNVELTNATTITAAKANAANNTTSEYEVAEFIPFAAATTSMDGTRLMMGV